MPPKKKDVAEEKVSQLFLNFLNTKKWFFAFFIKLIWLGVGFLNRTDAEKELMNLIKIVNK